jgi:hypothetical protein
MLIGEDLGHIRNVGTSLSERASLSHTIRCRSRDAKRAERVCTRLCPATELAGARVALLRCPILHTSAAIVL